MTESGDSGAALVRVCSKCSTQSQSAGDFCPHCGASYVKRGWKPRRNVVIASAALLVFLITAGAGLALKAQSDRARERDRAAEVQQQAEVAAEAEAEAEAEAVAAAQQERQDARKAQDAAERKVRRSIIRQMQQSITKDAKDRVADGFLDGPIMYTSCDPLGGGSVDDLTSLTTTFDCIAVNEELGDGRVSGYGFAATVNWDKASWTWQLDV